MKILIVEDNERNRKLFRIIVSSIDHEALTASDGGEGVQIAKASMPHLILMDIQMPGIDGIEALKMLRADEKTKNIPVIALTSYAMRGDRERFMEEGFADYISKPVHKDGLVETIRKNLRDYHGTDQDA